MIRDVRTYCCEEPIRRDVEYKTINPSNRTVSSSRVDQVWRESNCWRIGLSTDREAISPAEARRLSMGGMILNCETAVRDSIAATSTWFTANARVLPSMARL